MFNVSWVDIEVLIVEDSPTQAVLLHGALAEHGVKAKVAKNGLEALTELHKKIPTLIISDIEMPSMNGYELCRVIKADPKFNKIPIILLTNLSDPMDVIKGIECGADSFITKPFEINFLLTNISDILANQKLRENRVETTEELLEFSYGGNKHILRVNQAQITDLLLSTYTTAIQKNIELEEANHKLSRIHLELKRKNEELSLLNEQKNQFLGMAAHDLRNPLGVIQGYSAYLVNKLSKTIDQDYLDILNYIQGACSLMLQIINGLLDITIIESGQIKLQRSPIDIIHLAKHNMRLNQILAEKKGIKLNLKVEGEIPRVNCDSFKIDQVLNNLLSNAIKYSHLNSVIEETISMSKEGEVQFSIQDTGVGIPEKEREHLFEPFSKTSAKSTGGEESIGLGLSIVKKIVHEHSGKIWVHSKEGQGSTFYFTLPC